jgi:hypothetical protein
VRSLVIVEPTLDLPKNNNYDLVVASCVQPVRLGEASLRNGAVRTANDYHALAADNQSSVYYFSKGRFRET